MNQPFYKSLLLPLDLQLFSETPGAPPPEPPAPPVPPAPPAIELPKTAEELQKLLQSEGDKRVTGALKTAQEKWEAEFKAKLELEKAEAQKLAGLSAADKEKALLEKSKNEIEAREKAIAVKELKLETINILNEKKLPITLADFLLADDAEKTKSNVDTFEKAFREAIEAGVNERLKGTLPKLGTGGITGDNYGKKVAEAYSKKNEGLEKARQSYFN
ncbi:DUF4355 domain-containing protein [Neobacillus sp. NPDC058068]|uniref:DUF4355 domain-containing protein n=1 Tax=Neobacillus sp. NPDC058068 TaxID=3346325 RepID=UPI0036DA4F3D